MTPLRILFTAVVLAFAFIAQQSPGQEQPSQRGGAMSMDQMMSECMEHQQSAMKSIDQMTKMMEGAKESNDPAQMRTAMDEAQKELTEMKEHMSTCRNMMGMMQKMEGMDRMMKGGSR